MRVTITCRPPSDAQTRLVGPHSSPALRNAIAEREREWFKQQLQEFVDAMSPVWKLMPLDLPALLSHITSCINGRMCQVSGPRSPVPLDAVWAIRTSFRASSRASADGTSAWFRSRVSLVLTRRAGAVLERTADFLSLFDPRNSARPQGFGGPARRVGGATGFRSARARARSSARSIGSGTGAAFENQHALRMAADADDAIAEAEGGEVRFCYVTAEDHYHRRPREGRRERAADLQGLPEHGLRSAHRDHQRQ